MHVISIKIHDDELETPCRDFAASIMATANIEEILDKTYKALKESYLNVRDEKACVVHAYREDHKNDERNHEC